MMIKYSAGCIALFKMTKRWPVSRLFRRCWSVIAYPSCSRLPLGAGKGMDRQLKSESLLILLSSLFEKAIPGHRVPPKRKYCKPKGNMVPMINSARTAVFSELSWKEAADSSSILPWGNTSHNATLELYRFSRRGRLAHLDHMLHSFVNALCTTLIARNLSYARDPVPG